MATSTLPKEIKTEADLDALMNASAEERKGWVATHAAEGEGESNSGELGDRIKRLTREALKEYGAMNRPAVGSQANSEAPGAELDGKFKTLGEFMKVMSPKYREINGMDTRLKALAEGAGGDGGFLVPEEFRSQLLDLAIEQSVIRPGAMTLPMGSDTLKIPAIHDTDHSTNIFGGVQAFWEAEASTHTSSQPSFSQVQLTASKLVGFTQASMELLSDSSIALETMLMRMFGTALSYFEDDAFINGNGAGKPMGILNAPALIEVSKETGQDANTIVKENLDKMYSRMYTNSLNRAVWLAHPDTIPELFNLSQTVGTGGSPVMVTNIANAPTFSIYGRPVTFTEKCQTLGTKGDIMFVDLSFYLIGDRQAVTMSASEHHAFATDEMTWKFIQRLDGKPWVQSALTPRNGSNTLSPFVALADRS